jgi:sugar phosphate isomerase/epimerase
MKRVLHTVSYAGVWRGQVRLTLEQCFDKAAELGYDAVMIVGKRPHASALDMGPKEREALRARLDRLNLECACIAAYTDFTGGADRPDIPLREMQIAYVAEMCRLARDLGARFVRVFTGYLRPEHSFPVQWEWIVNALRECADLAEPFGVTLAVQNHHDIASTAAEMADLLREVDRPNVGAAYDAWAPTLQGLDVEAEIERIADRIVWTTTADYQWRKRFVYQPGLVNYQEQMDRTVAVPMGDGIIDYRRFFSALKRHGYDGHVAYEMCSELTGGGSMANLDSCARQFLRFMGTV